MILLIHPRNDMILDECIPLSLPAVVKRMPGPIVGRHHHEVTPRELRSANAIFIEAHWYTGLRSVIALAKQAKAAAPTTPVIIGGSSASIFSRQLLRDTPIDYVVHGDAERPAAWLAEALLENRDPSRVPNIIGRDFDNRQQYAVTREDLDTGNYRDIEWFPSLAKKTYWLHNIARGHSFPTWPFLVTYRGCPYACDECAGSIKNQFKLYNRNWVLRSPERVRDDLIAFSDDPRVSFVNLYHDILYLKRSYPETVFDRAYNLTVNLELFRCPSREMLERAMSCFRGGQVYFTLDEMHSISRNLADIGELIDRIRYVEKSPRFSAYLFYIQRYIDADPAYAKAWQAVRRETSINMVQADFWWDHNPLSQPGGFATEQDYLDALKPATKYYAMNTAFRLGTYAHAYAPGVAQRIKKSLLKRHHFAITDGVRKALGLAPAETALP